MIVAFDDTGTPTEGERFMVTAVYIQPSTWPAVLSAFERWKKLTRRKINGRPQEIKSTDLTDEMYKDFVNSVVFCPGSTIWHMTYAIDVDKHAIEWSKKQFEVYVEGYQKEIDIAKADPARKKWANEATTLMGWLRKTPHVYAIKMQVLNMAITDSINSAIGLSTVNRHDDELTDFMMYIDLGFIKDKATIFWKHMLANHVAQTPLYTVEGWPEDHPFYATFVGETRGDICRFNTEFSKRIDFYDSSTSPEVQIADIFAGLMRQRYIYDLERAYLTRLLQLQAKKDRAATMYQFGDLSKFDNRIKPPNIYEEFEKLDSTSN